RRLLRRRLDAAPARALRLGNRLPLLLPARGDGARLPVPRPRRGRRLHGGGRSGDGPRARLRRADRDPQGGAPAMNCRVARGFTLLEVMVAMAILAVSLVAIIGINGGTVRSHGYAKRLTIATMLARSKMADIETHFFHEGFTSQFDQT